VKISGSGKRLNHFLQEQDNGYDVCMKSAYLKLMKITAVMKFLG
jgi:hypothetical protein